MEQLEGCLHLRLVLGSSVGARAARYCSRACSVAHWPAHKAFCKSTVRDFLVQGKAGNKSFQRACNKWTTKAMDDILLLANKLLGDTFATHVMELKFQYEQDRVPAFQIKGVTALTYQHYQTLEPEIYADIMRSRASIGVSAEGLVQGPAGANAFLATVLKCDKPISVQSVLAGSAWLSTRAAFLQSVPSVASLVEMINSGVKFRGRVDESATQPTGVQQGDPAPV